MKRVLSLLFALVFVVAAFPVTVASAADVIEISDAAQLAAIGTNDNYPLSGSYKLTKNISLSDYENWTPIGQSSAFSGTFEGNGKTISGLKINSSGTYAGLFGQVSGTIKNLTVIGEVNLNTTASSATAIYAGLLAGNVSGWFATIDSCSTSGEVNASLNCTASFGFTSANVYAGGVIGNSGSWISTEILSHKSGTVTAKYTGSVNGNAYAGGIAGKITAGLVDCYNRAAVLSSSGKGSSYAGGLAGQCASTETSYNTGEITASDYCGSIAGYATGSSKNCYYETGSASKAFGGYSGSSEPTATSKKASEMTNKKLSGFNFDDVWESSVISAPNHYSKNEIITGSVSVLGSFQVGEKLTADMSKVSPSSAYDGLIKYVKYQWERGTKNEEGNINYEKISGATGSEYTVTAADLGKYLRLVVRGRFTYGGKLESKETLVTAAVPKNVKVATDDNGVKVTWDKISGATSYTIYRSTYSEGFLGMGAGYNSYSSVGTSTTNSFLDTTVTTNTKYKYKVTVTMGGTESDKSAESSEITAQLACQHQWDSGKETQKASCESTGVKTYTCSVCKGTRTETIPAKGHNFTTVSETKPTCEKEGTKNLFCSQCFNSKTETTPALGHSYDAGVITTEATCEADGVKTYTCATCKGTKTVVVEAKGHNFATATVTKEATCEVAGTKTGTCTVCKKTTQSTIPALGHNWSKDYTIDKQATYETAGEKSRHCTRNGCNSRTDVTAIPKLVKLTTPITKTQIVKNGINITWDKVENATGYNVYKSTKTDGEWSKWARIYSAEAGTTTYLDKNVVSGVNYKYAVSATASETETPYNSDKVITYLSSPVLTSIKSVSSGISFSWEKVAGAENYVVCRFDVEGDVIATLDANTTSYVDKNVENGKRYFYAIYVKNSNSRSVITEFSLVHDAVVVKELATPVVKITNAAKGIKVTWNKIENAENYTVYRAIYNTSTKKWSKWSTIKKGVTATSYTDGGVKLGTTYKYTVRALNGDVISSYKGTSGLKYNVTPTVKIENASTGIKVNWSTAANATGYTVYRSQYDTKTKKWSKWASRGTAKADKKSWTDKKVKSGIQYKYTVRAVNGKIKSSYKASNSVIFLTQPTVKIANASAGIKVSWSKVTGATGYTVYRAEYKNGSWSKWINCGTAKSSKSSWVDKKVTSGVKYKYTVRAVKGNSKSSYKSTGGLMYLAQPTVNVAVVNNGVSVEWSRTTGATSYVIYRSEYNAKTKKWSGWKNIRTESAIVAKWTDKDAKKGVTYKYTVRAVNGDYKSSYTASKNVKR